MDGAPHADAGAQVDGLVTDARCAREGPVGGMAVRHQQDILVDDGRQTVMQLGRCQRAVSRDESQGLSRAVARHEDADLFTGNTTLAGMAAPAARRTRQMPRPLLRFQHIQFVGLGDAMQAMRPVRFCQG